MRSAKFITTFDYDRSSWGLIERSTYTTEDMVNLDRFLCVAELVMLDMYRGNEVVTFEEDLSVSHYDPVCKEQYEWDIGKEQIANIPAQSDVFVAFGVKWRMDMILKGGDQDEEGQNVTVGLHLLENALGKRIVSIRCTFHVLELKVRYFTTMMFDAEHLDGDWGTGRVTLDKLQNLESCTIRLTMEMVDVYEDGMCVTHKVEQSRDIRAV